MINPTIRIPLEYDSTPIGRSQTFTSLHSKDLSEILSVDVMPITISRWKPIISQENKLLIAAEMLFSFSDTLYLIPLDEESVRCQLNLTTRAHSLAIRDIKLIVGVVDAPKTSKIVKALWVALSICLIYGLVLGLYLGYKRLTRSEEMIQPSLMDKENYKRARSIIVNKDIHSFRDYNQRMTRTVQ